MAGILTFEDVIERLMGEDIHDESDIGALPVLKKMAFVKARVQRLRKVIADQKAKNAASAQSESPQSAEGTRYTAPASAFLDPLEVKVEDNDDSKTPLLLS